jgi:hypothetical protein
VDNAASQIIAVNHVISEWKALEIREHDREQEETERFNNAAAACYVNTQGSCASGYDNAFLPTIVVDEGFLDQMKSSPSPSDELMKPVAFNRQVLMQRLRRKAEGGRSSHHDAKHAKYDSDSSIMSLDSILDDSSSNSESVFSRPLYNVVFDEVVNYATSTTAGSHDSSLAIMTSSNQHLAMTQAQTNHFSAAELTTVDMLSFVPLTPPDSVMSGGSVVEDCFATSLNDDCIITAFSEAAAFPSAPAASCTPPYSPPSGFSSFEEEYLPASNVEEDEFEFFEAYHQPLLKSSSISSPIVPVMINSARRDDLPELPIGDIENFFNCVDGNNFRLYDEIISSPNFLHAVDDMMMSSARRHGYQFNRTT